MKTMTDEEMIEEFLADTGPDETYSDDNAEYAEDVEDDEFTPSSGKSKPKHKPKQKTNTVKERKQKHLWNDTETLNLISLVEQHGALWDYNSAEYKMSRKDSWSGVVDALGIADVDVEEAKLKWANLKLTFNSNMAKYRKKKSGQGADETAKVVWRFFKPMFFLEANNVKKSTQSTSSFILVI